MVVLKSSVSNYINLDDKTYSYFAGNNYLGLANHPAVIRDVVNSVQKYGVNFSASRQTTGTSELHLELEKLLSEFTNQPASVVFASGYMGNRILLHALKDRYTAVFYDELSHPSFKDGFPAGISSLIPYDHCNPRHLELLLRKNRKFRPLIVTDGIFALTGEIAPFDILYLLAEQYNAIIIVDDAHATGILGQNGRGTCEHFHIRDTPNIYCSGTMSKALGAYGGFISADERIVQAIRLESAPYLASTALPPPITAAGCSAIKIIMQHPDLRLTLLKNANLIREGVKKLDFITNFEGTPIIPLYFNYEENATDLSTFLRGNNIIAPYVKYPVKIDKFIVRITVSAIHTIDQIENLLAVLKKWRDRHGSDKD
jgi:7-keto-8-aminopelargonate synthetase-like enzyme